MPQAWPDHHPFAALASAYAPFGAALAAQERGEIAGARKAYLALLDEPVILAPCLDQLGLLAAAEGNFDKAVDYFRHALTVDAGQLIFYEHLAIAFEAKEQVQEAQAVWMRLADAFFKADNPAGILAVTERVLARETTRYEAHALRGHALMQQGELPAAIAGLAAAISLHAGILPEARRFLDGVSAVLPAATGLAPGAWEIAALPTGPLNKLSHVLVSFGKGLMEFGFQDEAAAAFRFAVGLDPGFALAHQNLAMTLLTAGDYAEGWKEYDWRWSWNDFPEPRQPLPAPLWRGEDPAGRRIGILSEQGFGDALQFAGLALKLQARGASIRFKVLQPLLRLLRNGLERPGFAVLGPEDAFAVESEPLDYFLPMMSLPTGLDLTLDALPMAASYLKAESGDAARWASDLSTLAGRRVGLVWAGGNAYFEDAKRSLAVEHLAPLFQVPGISWISLQVGPGAARVGELPVLDASPRLTDFAETAAAVQNLDLVIAVDTAVAHLAGAMGKPVWILLPSAADWRWLRGRSDSPWYPTARLFRQPRRGDWPAVVAEVKQALEAAFP